MSSEPDEFWSCNNCDLTTTSNGYNGPGYTIEGRNKNWASIYQDIDLWKLESIVDKEMASSIFLRILTKPTKDLKIEVKASVMDDKDDLFYFDLASITIKPYEYNQWIEVSGRTIISKSGYDWNNTKRFRFYIDMDDPEIGYKADTAYFTLFASIALDNGPNLINNYDFEMDITSAIGSGWYQQNANGAIENVNDPLSPSGHRHIKVPSAAGGLNYDLTYVLQDISRSIELIHWTKSSGHQKHLNIKSQFVINHDGIKSYISCTVGCIVPNDGWRG